MQAVNADTETWNAELGNRRKFSPQKIDQRISDSWGGRRLGPYWRPAAPHAGQWRTSACMNQVWNCLDDTSDRQKDKNLSHKYVGTKVIDFATNYGQIKE